MRDSRVERALEYFHDKQDRKTELDDEYFHMKYLLEYVEECEDRYGEGYDSGYADGYDYALSCDAVGEDA